MRLDQVMVERGLAPSRTRAQALIKSGAVSVDGTAARKASAETPPDADIQLSDDSHQYVSRAALKLLHALDFFGHDPSGKTTLDLGSSTGGFTQVLLERGVSRVYAVDVGTDQLHPSLCSDPRVISMESTHAKVLDRNLVPEPLDLIVCDVSFISVMKALPPALALADNAAHLLTLIKPQFELGPDAIGKNGKVLTPLNEQRAFIDETIIPFFAQLGWCAEGVTTSPILGGDGTTEFLLSARKV
ncbi:MAG: TlyA family RNA methyltransferase [Pseudomonadota bacterium]